MKIVFDTNVLISGFITAAGTSQYILSRGFKRHQVVLSGYILREFEDKMSGKLKIPSALVQKAIIFLEKHTSLHPSSKISGVPFSDVKDIPILGLVASAKPHYFITGDRKLLEIKKMGPTLFLSPREAMEVL